MQEQVLTHPSPPAQQSAHPKSAVIAWLVILSCIVYIITHNAIQSRRAADNPDLTQFRFTLTARYMVGLKALMPARSADAAVDSLLAPILRPGASPSQQVRSAILLGELRSPRAALQNLDLLASQSLSSQLAADVRLLHMLYKDGPDALSQTQRQDLIERYGWLGRLALSNGLPSTDAQRSAALNSGIRTVLVAIGAMLLALAAGVVGVVLLILAIIQAVRRRLVMRYIPPSAPGNLFLEAFAVYLGGTVLISQLIAALSAHPTLTMSWFMLLLLPIIFLWPLFRGATVPQWRQGLGWHTGNGVFREMACGLLGYLAAMPLILLGLLVTFVLSRFAAVSPSHPIMGEVPRGGWPLVQAYLLACLWAPIVEETMFRGCFYHHLRQRWGWVVSGLAVALVFAAIHPQGWAAIPVLGSIGFTLAVLRQWRGTILAPMAAHALHNFVAVTLLWIMLG